jgi:hypothetical protein
VVDSGRVYWTRNGDGVSTGGFFSSALDGTDLRTHYQPATNKSCFGLAVVQGTGYFMCNAAAGGNEVRSCSVPTCATTTVSVSGLTTNSQYIAVDPATSAIYIATNTSYGQPPNGTITQAPSTMVGSAAQANPNDVAIASGFVYWLNAGTYSGLTAQKNGGVYRASLASLGTQSTVVGTNSIYFDNGTLAVDAANVYYTGRNSITNKSDVIVAPVSGGALTVFASDLGTSVVASDGTNVYFDDSLTSSLRYCSRTGGCGGTPTNLVTGEASVVALALDSVSVVWANGAGLMRRIAKP